MMSRSFEETSCSPGSNPEDQYAKKELLKLAFEALKPREAEVLRLRFFEGRTREEIGRLLRPEKPLTRERIRQIEGVAITKLRRGQNLPPGVRAYLEKWNQE